MELDDFFPVIMLYVRQLPAAVIGFICQIYCDLSVKQQEFRWNRLPQPGGGCGLGSRGDARTCTKCIWHHYRARFRRAPQKINGFVVSLFNLRDENTVTCIFIVIDVVMIEFKTDVYFNEITKRWIFSTFVILFKNI